MRNFCCNFTYNQLIIAGAHLGGKKKNINENYNTFSILSYNNMVCLDIKQAKKS
jgi:ribosomal protein S2